MKCNAKTKSGKQCQARATASGKCALHSDPGRAAELARKARDKRNRAKAEPDSIAPLEIPESAIEIKATLAKAVAEIYRGRLDVKVGTAMAYCCNVLLRAIETSELEQRIARLEELNNSGNDSTH